MSTRGLPFFFVLTLIGGLLCFGGYVSAPPSSQTHAVRERGKVLGHELTLDQTRWKEKTSSPLKVATKVEVNGGTSAGFVAERFFKDGEQAGEFMQKHPVGSEAGFDVALDGSTASWSSIWPSPSRLLMTFGTLLIGLGIARVLCPDWFRVSPEMKAVLFCLFFLFFGLVSAYAMWPVAWRQVQAAGWDEVTYERLGSRTISSGKSARGETAYRYRFDGKEYVTVKGRSSLIGDRANGGPTCRVNPTKPWQMEVIWGWHPNLGSALMSIPFLAVGTFAFVILLSPTARNVARDSWQGDGRRFRIPREVMNGFGGQSFVIVFVGSIIGTFVTVAATEWMENKSGKWVLTLFLMPFVGAWLWLVLRFFATLWRRIR